MSRRSHNPKPETRPLVLILASKFDVSCDYVVAKLIDDDVPYLRLNSEDLSEWGISIDPVAAISRFYLKDLVYDIDPGQLRSIYYRRPVFLRNHGIKQEKYDEFFKEQWAAFIRNLMIYDNCRWMNFPSNTYTAEHKGIQLRIAQQVGFDVPRSLITNSQLAVSLSFSRSTYVAIKGLDTVMISTPKSETFGYTSVLKRNEVSNYTISTAPLIVQQALRDKLDIRVTVVKDRVFAASILSNGAKIDGDWRLRKGETTYIPHDLPSDVMARCKKLTERFGLVFGAIDLAYQRGRYYFLEINPTGEWAWLVDSAKLPIDAAIADYLKG